MKPTLLGFLLPPLIAIGSALAAQEQSEKLPDSVQKRFQELRIATTNLKQEIYSGYEAAKTPQQRDEFALKSMKELQAKGSPLADQVLKLIEPHAENESAVEALAWLLTSYTSTSAGDKAARLLIAHHITHPKTQQLAAMFADAPMRWTEPMLKQMAAANIDRPRKGVVVFLLATCCKSRSEFPALLKSVSPTMSEAMKLRFGAKHFESLGRGDAAVWEQRAGQLYRRTIENYGELKYGSKTLSDHAKAALFEMKHLSIGKVAPQIDGKDIDGKSMKLSDFRGQVVLLDFWGHW